MTETLTRKENDRINELRRLLAEKPDAGPSDFAKVLGLTRQRAKQVLNEMVRKGVIEKSGYRILDSGTVDETENDRHPIESTPDPDIAGKLVAAEFPGKGLEAKLADGTVIVSRTLTLSLPAAAGTVGDRVFRLARALLKVEEPRP